MSVDLSATWVRAWAEFKKSRIAYQNKVLCRTPLASRHGCPPTPSPAPLRHQLRRVESELLGGFLDGLALVGRLDGAHAVFTDFILIGTVLRVKAEREDKDYCNVAWCY